MLIFLIFRFKSYFAVFQLSQFSVRDFTKKRPDVKKKITLTQIWYHMYVLVAEIIICQSVVKPQKPSLEMIEPNRGRFRNLTPGIIYSADHSAQKKKLGGNYKKVWKPFPFLERSLKGSRYMKAPWPCQVEETLNSNWGVFLRCSFSNVRSGLRLK